MLPLNVKQSQGAQRLGGHGGNRALLPVRPAILAGVQAPGQQNPFTVSPLLPCGVSSKQGVRSALVNHRTRTNPRSTAVEAPASVYTSVAKGTAEPLGPSKTSQGVNFSLIAPAAKSVNLCLFDEESKLLTEVSMNRSGDAWHIELVGLPASGVAYGYRVSGDGGWETGYRWDSKAILLDPYAPLVQGRRVFGKRDAREQFKGKAGSLFLGTYDLESPEFDWGANYKRPGHAMKDLVVYEMSVRCFTADPSSGLPEGVRGTFKGVAEKAAYLKSLGVTAVELLPVFEWDELEFQRSPNPRDHMVNVWGYSHISFFAPMSRLAAAGPNGGPSAAAREFKEMVKTLHEHGIEVLLDVVYNHTAEADDKDPYMLSFRGIDNKMYYMVDTTQYTQLINYSGCGNTVNANHPVVRRLIIDSLVHWVTEYHVDGFRFDLASCLCRDDKGRPMAAPPLIREISKHPLLSQVKLIAEPWDIGMYQVGSFPNWDIWGEWNGKYRDDVRRFLKGDEGMKGALATRLCGSADLYKTNNRKPYHSVNFIIAHDGFSLHDLVAYNYKHNDANGEGNRDGTNDNFSWNCGAEGETSDAGIRALRQRQMRNAMVVLMMSQGVPMMVMGDEVGKTHWGNNNWYGHDTPMAHMQWEEGKPERDGLLRFTSELIKLHNTHPALRKEHFIGPGDITWHEDNWANTESRFLAFTLHDKTGTHGDLYVALNAHSFPVSAPLPRPPAGRKWSRVVDTNLPTPKDFTPGGNAGVDPVYTVMSYSSIILLAKPL